MNVERLRIEEAAPPFPLYADPVSDLLRAHRSDAAERDAAVAHLLAVASTYAYADTRTVAMMMSRLGLYLKVLRPREGLTEMGDPV